MMHADIPRPLFLPRSKFNVLGRRVIPAWMILHADGTTENSNVGLVREPRDKHDRTIFDASGTFGRGIGDGPMTARPFDLLDSGETNRHPVIAFAEKLDEGLVYIRADNGKDG